MKATVFETIVYKAIKAAFDVLALIPPKTGEKIALFFSKIWFAMDKRHRKITIDNITHAFGDQMTAFEINRIARKTFFYATNMIFETPRVYALKPGDVSKHYTVNGLHHLRAAHNKGKGVLMFSGHLGNWEISVQLNNIARLQVSGVYRKLDLHLRSDISMKKGSQPAAGFTLSKGRCIRFCVSLARGTAWHCS
jgi:KDO2-lipid IV(A) lauroyltransferase